MSVRTRNQNRDILETTQAMCCMEWIASCSGAKYTIIYSIFPIVKFTDICSSSQWWTSAGSLPLMVCTKLPERCSLKQNKKTTTIYLVSCREAIEVK